MKKTKKWEQASQEKPKRRQRGVTLETSAESAPIRKKSRTGLSDVQAEEVEDRESQQKRIIESAFLVE